MNMNANKFRNILVTLMNIDANELSEAGVITIGVMHGSRSWWMFRHDSVGFVSELDDARLEALWQIVAKRQKQDDASKAFADWLKDGPRLAKAAGCYVGIKVSEYNPGKGEVA